MTLLGFRAENHPQQTAARGPLDHVDDRRTPPELFAALHAEFAFTLDAAASAENAKLPRFYDYQADGLAQSWAGERVWCNPPYSNVAPWVEKAWDEMQNGCNLVVMILPANRTEQRFWQDHVEPFRDGGRARSQRGGGGIALRTRFIERRVRFLYPPEQEQRNSPKNGSVLLIWTPT